MGNARTSASTNRDAMRGIGSTKSKKRLDCPALLKTWEEIREDYELEGDE